MDNQFVDNQNETTSEVLTDPAQKNSALWPEPRKYSALESVFAWICVVLGYLFCHAFPPTENPLGIFAVIAFLVVLSFPVLSKAGAKFSFISVLSAVLTIVFAAGLIMSAPWLAKMLAILCSAYAYCFFVYASGGNCLEKGVSDFVLIDFFRALFVYPFSGYLRIYVAMFRGKQKKFLFILKFLAGLLLAIIPTAIVVALLSYDGAFVELLDEVGDWLGNLNPIVNLGSLFFGILLAMYVFGLYTASTRKEKNDVITAEKCAKARKAVGVAPSATAAALLLPLFSVYVIFFISQWDYYISAFSGILPKEFSYAEYARNGFFELCWVSAINMALLSTVSFFVRRKNTADNVVIRVASSVFSFVTLILITTAISKMVLYIDAYGLTGKRVLASWFMILLAIIFVLIIFRQIFPKMKLIAVSTAVTALMLCVLLLSNYGGIIANSNVNRYIKGDMENVDVDALFRLGTPSVPALVRLAEHLEDEPEKLKEYNEIKAYLEAKDDLLEENKGIFAFSVPATLARNSLDEFFGR